MKFKIYWTEYHNPMNWGDTEEEGIKNIIEALPTKSWQYDPMENDGWIQVECEDIFEADNIEQAKKIASEYDIASDVFTVFDEEGKRLFTEEDLEVDIVKCSHCKTDVDVNNQDGHSCWEGRSKL